MITTPILVAARAAYAAGLCTVPPLEDGSKAPVSAWKSYQVERPDTETLRRWFAGGAQGLGAVCGKVSSNLEVIEWDDRAIFERFVEVAQASGLGDLVARMRAGYEEETPGDGVHLPYFCEEIAGNKTLARRPLPGGKRKALIQTRGEGGYIVLAPSGGKVHPTGRSYRLVSGSFATIPTITPEERRALWELARSFDEVLRPETGDPSPQPTSPAQGDRPGDLFNQVTSWDDLLAGHGWTFLFHRNGVGYWRRPGKDHGISGTTNWGGYDYFYPFTSSTEFDEERGYTKFAAYAILEHGSDFKEAARALRAQGYGAQGPRRTTATLGGEAVDVATPEAEVDDKDRAIAELRARLAEAERDRQRVRDEWAALGQFLANEAIGPAERIVLYKLGAAYASTASAGELTEDGYGLIRYGETHRAARTRVAREEGPEAAEQAHGWGLAASAGVDRKTIARIVDKFGPPSPSNPQAAHIFGKREEVGGRTEDGRPKADILIRMPSAALSDILVEYRDFAPETPRNHGGKREPCPRCGSPRAKTIVSCADCGLVLKETIRDDDDPDDGVRNGVVEAVPTAIASADLRDELPVDEADEQAVSVPPTRVVVPPQATYPTGEATYHVAPVPLEEEEDDEEETDTWDIHECNYPGCDAPLKLGQRYCDHHLGRPFARKPTGIPLIAGHPVAVVESPPFAMPAPPLVTSAAPPGHLPRCLNYRGSEQGCQHRVERSSARYCPSCVAEGYGA